jgi:hypothetical protein
MSAGINWSLYDKCTLSMQIARLEGYYWVARMRGYAAAALPENSLAGLYSRAGKEIVGQAYAKLQA